jgi:hypothetical protein
VALIIEGVRASVNAVEAGIPLINPPLSDRGAPIGAPIANKLTTLHKK